MVINREEAIKNSMPQSELVDEYIDSLDKSENTIISYRGILRRYCDYLRVHHIDKPVEKNLKKYKDFLINDKEVIRHSATIQKTIVCLRMFYRWCEKRGFYPNISTELEGLKITPTFKRNALEIEDAMRLLDLVEKRKNKSITNLRDCAIVNLILKTGLRTVEVERANTDDIVEKGQYTYLYVQGKGRDDKDDPIKLPESVLTLINEYLEKRNSDDIALFINHGNNIKRKRIDTKTISMNIKHLFRAIGIDDKSYTAHSLRHTCATIALKEGASFQQVQEVLRHKSINTTTIYAHNMDREKNNVELIVDQALKKK